MNVKKQYPILIVAAFIAVIFDSCSPTITPLPPTTLIHTKTGKIVNPADTCVYDYALSCGCAFPLAVDAIDTTSIIYDTANLKDTANHHKIKASVKPGLSSGKHTGFLAITTIQPITTELLKDTLRDTVIVP